MLGKREILKPVKTLKTYNEVAALKSQEVKQLCEKYKIDLGFPKKAKLILLCHALGISTTGETKANAASNRNTYTVLDLSASQLEEFEQLLTFRSFTGIKEWTTDLTLVPDIDESVVKKYLVQTNELTLKSARTYKVSRPYQLKSNVNTIRFFLNPDSETFSILSARCNPSQSTSPDEVKVLFVIIDKITGVPYGGLCTCTVGCSETCGHIGAALFRLADLVTSGVKEVPAQLACTEKLCEWTDPKGSKAPATVLDELTIKKVEQPVRRTVNDFGKKIANPDPPSYDAILQLQSSLYAATFQIGQFCPAVSVLNAKRFRPPTARVPEPQTFSSLPDTLSFDSPELTYSKELIVETVPLQITDFPHKKFTVEPQENELHHEVEKFVSNLKYSSEDIKTIENSTTGQSTNPLWFQHRKGAITASIFSKVMSAVEKNKQSCDSLVKEILVDKKPKMPSIPALKWGLTHEKTAKTEYMRKFQKWHKDLELVECGLKVCKENHFIRVSPDGLVHCKCHNEDRLLEIKCPYASRALTVREAVKEGRIKYLETENGHLVLKKKSSEGYFVQCQGLMGVCGLKNCNFVVWTPKDLVTISVPFDDSFWRNRLLPACVTFFKRHIVPRIIFPIVALPVKPSVPEIIFSHEKKRNKLQHEQVPKGGQNTTRQPTELHKKNVKVTLKTKPVKLSNSQQKPALATSYKDQLTQPNGNLYRCGMCRKVLPEDNILPDNSNASVGCDCPNCGGCDVWFCWPCAKYDDDWLQEATDWYCPHCTKTCDIVY